MKKPRFTDCFWSLQSNKAHKEAPVYSIENVRQADQCQPPALPTSVGAISATLVPHLRNEMGKMNMVRLH
jgi:hypothetical protein